MCKEKEKKDDTLLIDLHKKIDNLQDVISPMVVILDIDNFDHIKTMVDQSVFHFRMSMTPAVGVVFINVDNSLWEIVKIYYRRSKTGYHDLIFCSCKNITDTIQQSNDTTKENYDKV